MILGISRVCFTRVLQMSPKSKVQTYFSAIMLTLLTLGIGFLERYKPFKKLLLVEEDRKITKYPKECHRVVHFDKNIQKVLFVGDVHGCCDELTELLERCVVDKEKEDILIVFVGDLVNKGPKNVETLRLVRNLGKMAYSVRGNHEEAVLSRLTSLEKGSVELPKKYFWITELSCEDRTFLEELPFSISIPSLNVIVVHGGFVPGVKLQEQLPRNMINMRNYIPETLSGTADIDEGIRWGSQWPGPEFVIFGHDARRRLQRYRRAIGLDTGCLYGGKLTGFLLNLADNEPLKSGKLISVNAHMDYLKP